MARTFCEVAGRLVTSLLLGATGWLVSATGQAQSNSRLWLDQPVSNWNTSGGSIPKAPKAEFPLDALCSENYRKVATPEDRSVAKAGWSLTDAPADTDHGVTIIWATIMADGMCRPFGYEVFVFVEGKFAGTISPIPMRSREDASLEEVTALNATTVTATFARYRKSDVLCCPSGQSLVKYRIERRTGVPLLVPISIQKQ